MRVHTRGVHPKGRTDVETETPIFWPPDAKLDMEQQLVPNRKRSMSRLYIVTLLI